MVVGLTGGIGSGKSTVAKLFELLGCPIFESDLVAKQLYFDPIIKQKVISLLGKESYINDSLINKAFISSAIFSNSDLRHQLNAIIHPAVISKSKDFIKEHSDKLVIKETALLYEAQIEKEVDKIILVVANDELRIKRVMLRDGLSKADVQMKINNQLSQEALMKKADFIIYNEDTQLLIPQVMEIYTALLEI